MKDYGPGSSMRSRYGGPWQITGWQQQWEAIQHPMAECGDGDSSNGRPLQGPMTHSGPGSSMREAVQGPMTDYGPGSSMRSRYGGPWQITGLAAA
ncbi:unnamed protein product [Staurois parvus]|uniref:Uncharacterized protein n=1 Tax=Staurois parvus TaxID=386267 RepID=A0ABN9CCC4_9NEOB|nr:unnamed protein product [Staurois parvus]